MLTSKTGCSGSAISLGMAIPVSVSRHKGCSGRS